MSGKVVPQKVSDFITQNESVGSIKIKFEISHDNLRYFVFYSLEIEKVEEGRVRILNESLDYKEMIDGLWKSKSKIIEFDVRDKERIFKPIKNLKLITTQHEDVLIDLGVAKKIAGMNNTSFIFSNEFEEIINQQKSFHKYANIISTLKDYANKNLFIIKNENSGLINLNILIPFNYRLLDDNKNTQGEIVIGLVKPNVVREDTFNKVVKIIDQMNIVLSTIIPGLVIDVKNYGNELMKDGKQGIRLELVSRRGSIIVPLRYESDGIKKIISILNTLIIMYNNPSVCVVIDELDAGVFEYLLGEILQIISENGRGQLIFTSHNLRPLEMLQPCSLIFTTTNGQNRYMRFTNIKSNNNLRNLYYRSINLGGQKEEIYEETNSFDISRAFRAAGRVIDED